MKRTITVGLMIAMTALLACNKDSAGGSAGSSGGSGGGGGGSGGSIGIKECDDYIKTWNDCYKDPTMRAAAEPGFKQMKDTWATQAKDPASKAALASGCKMALDNFPKAACK
jgi:hypothetical protein